MSPRRPVREKQTENKDFRLLLLALYGIPNPRLLWMGELSAELREALFRSAQTDSFVAKRRYEREVVNLMREEDEEGLTFLQSLLEEPEQYQQQYNKSLQEYAHKLVDPDQLAEFVEAYPTADIQLLRQRLRNHAQKNTQKTEEQIFELLAPLLFPLDWR